MSPDPRQAAEKWFLAQGLPWFVDAEHDRPDLPRPGPTETTTELEHAVGVRAVYRALH